MSETAEPINYLTSLESEVIYLRTQLESTKLETDKIAEWNRRLKELWDEAKERAEAAESPIYH